MAKQVSIHLSEYSMGCPMAFSPKYKHCSITSCGIHKLMLHRAFKLLLFHANLSLYTAASLKWPGGWIYFVSA